MKPFYLLILTSFLAVTCLGQNEPMPVRLKDHTVSTMKNLLKEDHSSLEKTGFKDDYYVLIQFDRLPGNTENAGLRKLGINLFQYLPENTYLATVPKNVNRNLLLNYKTRALYQLEPAFKFAPGLEEQITQPAFHKKNVFIAVYTFGNLPREEVAQIFREAGAQIAATKIAPPNVIFITADAVVLKKIAALPFVAYCSLQQLESVPLNYNNRARHGINSLSLSTGRNLQGKNVTIGIGDDANITSHIDLEGRVIDRNPAPVGFHGTHVSATAAGAGNLNQRYRGMAPKATIVNNYFTDILVNTPLYVSSYDMALTNNSYHNAQGGCAGNGEYDVLSYFIDNLSLNYPSVLNIFAAGNDGRQTCAPYLDSFHTVKSGFQVGKNVLTVGAMNTAIHYLAILSSRGPSNDGRVKPEIVAGGWAVVSASQNNTYVTEYGTSMSAPTVTGAAALLVERYRQLHGSDPSAALMKAILCNSADDLGNPGPDYSFGFGMLNARKAVEALEANQYFESSVNNGGTANFNITGVPAGTRYLKVMLYWPDAPATPFAANALINNLDLTVTTPTAVVHHPLILNAGPANVKDPAVEGTDNINNIEQIIITNPPAGNFTITVNGTNIPSGPQPFVVAYELIQPGITLEYPVGEEKWVPGVQEIVRWTTYDNSSNTFTLQYSTNNGTTWTTINNSIPADSRNLVIAAPNAPTNQALMRITRNVEGTTATSPDNFTILGQPNLTVSNPCSGYAQLNWPAIASATGYEIMMLKGDSMETIASSPANSFLVSGLNSSTTYWLAVRAMIGGAPGPRSLARTITPSGGACSLATFNNDLTADLLVAPQSGRQNTSGELGSESIQVRLRNLGTVATAGSYDISYQVNGGSIVTESAGTSIGAASTNVYTFATPYDFTATGTYTVKAWVTFSSDGQHANDMLTCIVKSLQNDPLLLTPSFTENFESAADETYTGNTVGLEGLDRADFNTNNSNGRARTYVNDGFARSGNRALVLDQKRFSFSTSSDSLITTFNLSGYSSLDQLWLDFYYRNQGIDFYLPGNQVWIRGSDADEWVPAFTLPVGELADFGIYKKSSPINITETLAAAVPSQTVSSSFQVKFGEQGFTSTNNVTPTNNLDDGFIFDDIILTNASNDVGILALVNPDISSLCSLGTAEPIGLRVKNYSGSVMTNIAVTYRINGSAVNEVIPSLNAGEETVFMFAQTANLAAYQQYTFDAWVNYGTDNYNLNDSLLNIKFNTVPVISSFPYLEDFESNNGYWYTRGIGSSWQYGTPANVIIDKAASGSKAWVTSLTSNHNNSEQSYLISPCFDLSGMAQPVLSFSHISNMEDDCDCDFHWVEYSTDGVNWLRLGSTSGGTNWYDHSGVQAWQLSNENWHVSSHDIPVTDTRVRFRFVMLSDPGVSYEGVGIDDIHVFDKAAIYTGSDITGGLTQAVSGTGWTHFTSGGNRIVSINPNGQDLGVTEARVYFNTDAVRVNGKQYYLDRNIVVQPSNAPSSPVTVRFYFTNTEINNLINATGCPDCTSLPDAYEAGITQYSEAPLEENGTLLDNTSGIYNFIIPAAIDVVPYDNGYYAEYQVTNFSEFWLNGGGPDQNQALPFKLGTFTVTQVNNDAVLDWNTLQEINTARFEIERSINGVDFTTIGQVPAGGNVNTTTHYSFTDPQPASGIYYYRIRFIDIDGKFVYSSIKVLTISGNGLYINIYPNPVEKGVLYINTSASTKSLEIHDVSGRLVRRMQVTGTSHVIPVKDLSKGLYFVRVTTEAGNKTEKILIK